MSNFSLSIREWFRQNSRDLPWRQTSDPYLIWLSEVILQQTRVEQGLPYFQRFASHYPDVNTLANSEEQAVLNDWQGLGYYSRARNMLRTARIITEEKGGQFPESYSELIDLKGIGPYTAAAVSSFAFGEKRAVVDGNVYRVLSRVFNIDTPINSTPGKKTFQELADRLIDDKDPGEHNQALMELGAVVCKPRNPSCTECPVNNVCLAYAQNTFQSLPVKTKKGRVKDRYFHYLVFEENNETILEQRTEKDIWQMLYQFPIIESTSEIASVPENYSSRSKEFIHLLSHQRIHARFYSYDNIPAQLKNNWIRIPVEEIDRYPLPRLIDKYLETR